MQIKSIERFFLNTLLRISMAGVFLILLSDVFLYPADTQSIVIDVVVFSICTLSYLMRNKWPQASVLVLTIAVLVVMVYQCLSVPISTTNSLSVILLVGFICSVMLKGKTMIGMHLFSVSCIVVIFVVQYRNPGMRFTEQQNEMATVIITYSIIYFILTYATAVLKESYDRMHLYLRDINIQLNQKAGEIAVQNEELVKAHDNLNQMNTDLEQIVNDRTARIRQQNEILLRYAYTNAHHLRGPVERLL
jgi:hypothetical protein